MVRAKREMKSFSPEMVELGLRELFAEISANVYELADEECPETLPRNKRQPIVFHILSGNLPNPGVVSIVIGLLAGARNIVKPAAYDPMPRLFVESLVETMNGRGSVRITNNREAYRTADIVVAYGTNETLSVIRKTLRPGQKLLGFGHRVSIGIIAASRNPRIASRDAAVSASMWDQQGCMSPQAFYVAGYAERFATALAEEMEKFDRRWPRAPVSFEDAAAIARARSEWSFRGTVWASKGSTRWTVVLDTRGEWSATPLNRFVFVRPLSALRKIPRELAFSTIGIHGCLRLRVVAERVCPLGTMQKPSLLESVSRPKVSDLMR